MFKIMRDKHNSVPMLILKTENGLIAEVKLKELVLEERKKHILERKNYYLVNEDDEQFLKEFSKKLSKFLGENGVEMELRINGDLHGIYDQAIILSKNKAIIEFE